MQTRQIHLSIFVVGFQSIKVSTQAVNLFVHPQTNDIWFGASPVRYKLLDYFKNPTKNAAPSQVDANNYDIT